MRTGALTLLITVVAVCLAVLSVLALCTARADRALAQKQTSLAAENAKAECAGQEWLAQVDAFLTGKSALPQNAQKQADGTIRTDLNVGGGRTLTISVRPTGKDLPRYTVLQWEITGQWSPDSGLKVWPGN